MWFIRIKRGPAPLSRSLLKTSLKFPIDLTYSRSNVIGEIRGWIRRRPSERKRERERRTKEKEELNYVLEKNFLRRSNDREISEGNCVWQTGDGFSPCSLLTRPTECVFSSLSNLPCRDSRNLFQRESPWFFFFCLFFKGCSNFARNPNDERNQTRV